MSFVSDFIFQSGDTNTWGSRGYVAHLQPAAGGRQPKSLNHQVCLFFLYFFAPYWQPSFSSFVLSLIIWDFSTQWKQSDVTNRKVQTESSTGSVGSSRVRTTLTLCVETIDFDSQACQLRVKGTNIQENQYVKVRVHLEMYRVLFRIFNFNFIHISKVCCTYDMQIYVKCLIINSVDICSNFLFHNIPYVNVA